MSGSVVSDACALLKNCNVEVELESCRGTSLVLCSAFE